MRNFIKISSGLLIAILFSCEEQGFLVNCKDCTVEEPTTATIEADLDVSDSWNDGTLVKIYEGNIEDSVILGIFRERTNKFNFEVPLNKTYTLTATYHFGAEYTAVNCVFPRVRYNKEQCDDPCYFVYDRKINLKLKYIKDY